MFCDSLSVFFFIHHSPIHCMSMLDNAFSNPSLFKTFILSSNVACLPKYKKITKNQTIFPLPFHPLHCAGWDRLSIGDCQPLRSKILSKIKTNRPSAIDKKQQNEWIAGNNNKIKHSNDITNHHITRSRNHHESDDATNIDLIFSVKGEQNWYNVPEEKQINSTCYHLDDLCSLIESVDVKLWAMSGLIATRQRHWIPKEQDCKAALIINVHCCNAFKSETVLQLLHKPLI